VILLRNVFLWQFWKNFEGEAAKNCFTFAPIWWPVTLLKNNIWGIAESGITQGIYWHKEIKFQAMLAKVIAFFSKHNDISGTLGGAVIKNSKWQTRGTSHHDQNLYPLIRHDARNYIPHRYHNYDFLRKFWKVFGQNINFAYLKIEMTLFLTWNLRTCFRWSVPIFISIDQTLAEIQPLSQFWVDLVNFTTL